MIFVGKKGQSEETEVNQVIVYVFVCMLILLAAIMGVNRFAENITVEKTCHTKNIEFTLLAARVINSATCLAWEEPVGGLPSGDILYGSKTWFDSAVSSAQKHQVRAGIIDLAKLTSADGGTRVRSCLETDRFVVEAYGALGDKKASIGLQNLKTSFVETYIVKFFENGKFSDGRIKIAINMSEGDRCV